jgi:hypothetical protein
MEVVLCLPPALLWWCSGAGAKTPGWVRANDEQLRGQGDKTGMCDTDNLIPRERAAARDLPSQKPPAPATRIPESASASTTAGSKTME